MHKWKGHSGPIHHAMVHGGPIMIHFFVYWESTHVPISDLNAIMNNFLLFQLDLTPYYSIAREQQEIYAYILLCMQLSIPLPSLLMYLYYLLLLLSTYSL